MRGRVVHVLRKYDPLEWGGTETHVAEVTRRLVRMGWEVEVHAPHGPKTPDTALDPAVRLRRYRSFLPMFGDADGRRGLIKNAGNIVTLDEPVRLFCDRNTTLAHLHSGGRMGGAVRTAMRLTHRPYVVSVHGPLLANREWLEADTARRMAKVVDVGQPFGAIFGSHEVLDDAARVISFNEEERVAIAERVGDRSIRMDHGVDVERLSSGDRDRAKQLWPELGDDPVILLVGRLASQKNQVFAVRAFAQSAADTHRLVFAGAATDVGYRERIEKEIRERGVGDRVHILGNVPRDDVPHLYRRADILLIASTHEAFGLIVLEGWAAGLPVLFPRLAGLADIADALGHDDASVAGFELDEWAGRLRRLAQEEGARRDNARAGMALVRSRYDWDRVTERLSDLYEEVLREQSPRRGGK
jgi:glycosyltransferase involved in cell wall biosynthesis